MARVLDVVCPFDQRFEKVSPCREERNDDCQTEPDPEVGMNCECAGTPETETDGCNQVEHQTAIEAFPRFLGGNPFEQFMLAHH